MTIITNHYIQLSHQTFNKEKKHISRNWWCTINIFPTKKQK